MARGGLLYVYCEAGPLCVKAPKEGAGVIVEDGRMSITEGTVSMLRRFGLRWCQENAAYVIDPEKSELARMIGEGRDVIAVGEL